MEKAEVIKLARELFKIRLASSREGFAEDDGVHKLKIKGISTYDDATIKKWYKEALTTAEIIIGLEEVYLSDHKRTHPHIPD